MFSSKMTDLLMTCEHQRDAEAIFERRCRPTAYSAKIAIEARDEYLAITRSFCAIDGLNHRVYGGSRSQAVFACASIRHVTTLGASRKTARC
jgi:hypothetical protein